MEVVQTSNPTSTHVTAEVDTKSDYGVVHETLVKSLGLRKELDVNARVNAPIWTDITGERDESSEAPSSTSGSTLSTSGSVEEVREAAEEVTDILLEDEVLSPLDVQALTVMKIETLEKEFTTLLEACAIELQTKASNITEQRASRFLRANVRRIVSYMGICLDRRKQQLGLRLQETAAQKPRKRTQLDAFIKDEAVDLYEQEPDAASNTGSSEQEAPENLYLYHRDQIKSFILKSAALVNLKEKLGQFVLESQYAEIRRLKAMLGTGMIADDMSLPLPRSLEQGRMDTRDKLDNRPREHPLVNILDHFLSGYVSRCIQLMLRAAECLELREKPLEPGFRRVKWRCVSNTLFRLLAFMLSQPSILVYMDKRERGGDRLTYGSV